MPRREHDRGPDACVEELAGSTLPRMQTDGPGPGPDAALFEQYAEEALESLPEALRARMSNVEIVIDDEPPRGQPLLGLYQGVPLTRRSSYYGGVLPDKITLYRGPLVRLYGYDGETLRREVRRVVLHEIAHHFGISDARLVEIDRY
jgi:predicted Zn-dependent protease with MMP-like domain